MFWESKEEDRRGKGLLVGELGGSRAVAGDQEEPAWAGVLSGGPRGLSGASSLKYTTASPCSHLQPVFHVMGFSVTGRVLNGPEGEGVPDAVVTLNSQIKGGQTRWAQAWLPGLGFATGVNGKETKS